MNDIIMNNIVNDKKGHNIVNDIEQLTCLRMECMTTGDGICTQCLRVREFQVDSNEVYCVKSNRILHVPETQTVRVNWSLPFHRTRRMAS